MNELERAAQADRESVQELRLAVARLRAEQCRVEADAASARRKAQQAHDALDAEREKAAKVRWVVRVVTTHLDADGAEQAEHRHATELKEVTVRLEVETAALAKERLESRKLLEAVRCCRNACRQPSMEE